MWKDFKKLLDEMAKNKEFDENALNDALEKEIKMIAGGGK